MKLTYMNYSVHHLKVLRDYLFLLMMLQIMMKQVESIFFQEQILKFIMVLTDGRSFCDQPINDLIRS